VLTDFLSGAAGNVAGTGAALSLLCELARDPRHRAALAAAPALHRALPALSHFAYALLLGAPEGVALADVRGELEWWAGAGIFEYVDAYDRAVGRPPPHLFAELARVDAAAVAPLVPALLEMARAGDARERRAAFFALAHFAAAPAAVEWGPAIVEAIGAGAIGAQSYVVRGTAIAALSLVNVTAAVADALRRAGFVIFRFGGRKCVVPADEVSLLLPIERHVVQLPPARPAPSAFCNAAAQLLNPIQRSAATATLVAAAKERASELMTIENAMFVMRLLAENAFQIESRQLLIAGFQESRSWRVI
jgi:hypothetical protein